MTFYVMQVIIQVIIQRILQGKLLTLINMALNLKHLQTAALIMPLLWFDNKFKMSVK